MLLVVPVVLMVLLRYAFDRTAVTFDHIAPILIAIFPFVLMFVVTSVAMLRERTTGTLERLLSTPIAKLDLLVGYALAFGLVAVVQVALVVAVVLGPLGVNVTGSVVVLSVFGVLDALLGMALGLCLSALAHTEFQAVQLLPGVVFPQLLVCGLFAPRDQMAGVVAGPRRRVSAHLCSRWSHPCCSLGCVERCARPGPRHRGPLHPVGPGAWRGHAATSNRMSRQRGRRAAGNDTRAEILVAARELFGENGYAATTMRAIAQRAGVDAALIHHHFGSKEALFRAVMQISFDPAAIAAIISGGESTSLGERLCLYFLELWEDAAT